MHRNMKFTHPYTTFGKRERNTYSVAFVGLLRPGSLTTFGNPAL